MTLTDKVKTLWNQTKRNVVLGTAGLALITAVESRAQVLDGTLIGVDEQPLPNKIVTYILDQTARSDTTDTSGYFALDFRTTGIEEPSFPQIRNTTWGKIKADYRNAPPERPSQKAMQHTLTTFFPDTLYVDGMTEHWSSKEPITNDLLRSGDMTFNLALPPYNYTFLPTHPEGVPIVPIDNADIHNLKSAPIDPRFFNNARLWHPDRIQQKIKVDIRLEWTQAEHDYILQCLNWIDTQYDIKGIYGMDSIFQLVTRGSTTYTQPGIWRIRKSATGFSCEPQYEIINGEYFIKHDEIFLQYANQDWQHFILHEFTHGVDGSNAHVDWYAYNGDGISLMNGHINPPVPPDKAYQNNAYRLQKLRLQIPSKNQGKETNYTQ